MVSRRRIRGFRRLRRATPIGHNLRTYLCVLETSRLKIDIELVETVYA
jgi:hypothetical protein